MPESIKLTLMFAGAAVITALLLVWVPTRHRAWMWLSLVAHFAVATVQYSIVMDVYRGADTVMYFREGRALATLMSQNPSTYVPLVLDALFQLDPDNYLGLIGGQSSTGSMSALAGLVQLAFGSSFAAMCFAVGFLAYVGKLLLYQSLRAQLPAAQAHHVLVATMLVPSAVYWSSVFAKESVAIAFLWAPVEGFRRILNRSLVTGLLLIALGTVPIGLFKPYILFALAPAFGFWWVHHTASLAGRRVRLRLPHLLAAAVATSLLIALLADRFPRFDPENLMEETARLQEIGSGITAGSNYTTVDPANRSVTGQMLFAPVGLLYALFRPAVFDINGATAAFAALESTALTVLFFRAATRQGFTDLAPKFARSPLLAFGVAFTLIFGSAAGVASTNLGTLFRYRTPMVPFYVLSLLALVPPGRSSVAGVRVSNASSPPRPRVPAPSVVHPASGSPVPRGGFVFRIRDVARTCASSPRDGCQGAGA
jgi:hypothetical protein